MSLRRRVQSAMRALWGASVTASPQEHLGASLKAAYYASAGDSPLQDFSRAHDVSFRTALAADLDTMRARCRYEQRQNTHAKGLPRTYANSVIATGALPLVTRCASREWARDARRAFLRWARHADYLRGLSLGQQLHLGCRQLFVAGEYLLVRRYAAQGDVRLRYLMIRPDRLRSPERAPNDARVTNGVEVDADGRPAAYWILPEDPDNGIAALLQPPQRVPASQVVHVFYTEDPVQHRGEPWLAQSLPIYHRLRRYDDATVAAATIAAKFAAVLVNLQPDAVADVERWLPPGVVDLWDGQLYVPPAGYEPKQITPQHPSTNASEFRRDQLATAGAGVAMPKNIATQDSSGSSFASARFDGVSFAQDGEVVRGLIEDLHLDRVWEDWLTEAVAVGLLPPPPPHEVRWLWPQEDRHTDPNKRESANDARVRGGRASIQKLAMEDGEDGEEILEELFAEIDEFRERNLRHPFDAGAAPAPTADRGPTDADDKADDEADEGDAD